MSLYREDFSLWLKETIEKINNHRWHQIDFMALLKELLKLEDNEKYYLLKDLETIIYLLLKYKIDKELASNLLYNLRRKIQILLERSPSMNSELNINLETIYQQVKIKLVKELNVPLTDFHIDCPYSIEDLLDLNYFE